MTQEVLHQLFYYENGNLIWNQDRSDKTKKGMIAGHKKQNGYIQININKKIYLAHRLIYLYHHGILPKYIDHVNRLPYDNRIENLRECTQQQNLHNKKPFGHSKYKGVYKTKNKIKKYKSQILAQGKLIYLGTFETQEQAASAYNDAALKYYGDFAYLNKIFSHI